MPPVAFDGGRFDRCFADGQYCRWQLQAGCPRGAKRRCENSPDSAAGQVVLVLQKGGVRTAPDAAAGQTAPARHTALFVRIVRNCDRLFAHSSMEACSSVTRTPATDFGR